MRIITKIGYDARYHWLKERALTGCTHTKAAQSLVSVFLLSLCFQQWSIAKKMISSHMRLYNCNNIVQLKKYMSLYSSQNYNG